MPVRVDTILCGGAILTMDDTGKHIIDGAIAINDGDIVAVGKKVDVLEEYSSTNRIDDSSSIILPGLVNTHCHTAMTLFRGSADDRDLNGFLKTVWELEKKYISAETVNIGIASWLW